jgi:hypothetical protein
MTQYLLLIHGNEKTASTPDEWDQFFASARQRGLFQGGSEVGKREMLGDTQSAGSQSALTSDHIVGYMRFDAEDKQQLLDLLKRHPVVLHGGSVELCELPNT